MFGAAAGAEGVPSWMSHGTGSSLASSSIAAESGRALDLVFVCAMS